MKMKIKIKIEGNDHYVRNEREEEEEEDKEEDEVEEVDQMGGKVCKYTDRKSHLNSMIS